MWCGGGVEDADGERGGVVGGEGGGRTVGRSLVM